MINQKTDSGFNSSVSKNNNISQFICGPSRLRVALKKTWILVRYTINHCEIGVYAPNYSCYSYHKAMKSPCLSISWKFLTSVLCFPVVPSFHKKPLPSAQVATSKQVTGEASSKWIQRRTCPVRHGFSMALIEILEIDGLPFLIAWWFSANCEITRG